VSSSTSSTDWLLAGRVGRPHGLDGSFHVVQPRPELLQPGTVLRLDDEPRQIVRRAGTDAKPILRLERCHSREDAEALRGRELRVAARDAPALGDGEWWVEELVGCLVRDGDREVGVVRGVLGLPSCDVLEVDRPEGEELLVPLVRDAVRDVDVRRRRIDVDLGFLEGG
jgi:16S rRNA processing protein RimM